MVQSNLITYFFYIYINVSFLLILDVFEDTNELSNPKDQPPPIDFKDLKGLSIKISGENRSVSIDEKENNDDEDYSDYVPVSEVETIQNGDNGTDVEMKLENGEKTVISHLYFPHFFN